MRPLLRIAEQLRGLESNESKERGEESERAVSCETEWNGRIAGIPTLSRSLSVDSSKGNSPVQVNSDRTEDEEGTEGGKRIFAKIFASHSAAIKYFARC